MTLVMRASLIRHFGLALSLASVITACGEDEDGKKESLGLPALQPPVQRNTPAGMAAGSSLTQTQAGNQTPLQSMASRLFQKSPTSILERLASVDMRMSRFDSNYK